MQSSADVIVMSRTNSNLLYSEDVIVTQITTVVFGNLASCCIVQDIALDANGQWIKCVLNVTNIVFHMTFGKYPNLGASENFQTSEKFQKHFFV